MRFSIRSLMAMAVCSLAAASSFAEDIVDTAVAAGKFKTLAAALNAAGLVDTLKGEGPFTVFAPTDEAFAKVDQSTLQALLKPENKDKLTGILTLPCGCRKSSGKESSGPQGCQDCQWATCRH